MTDAPRWTLRSCGFFGPPLVFPPQYPSLTEAVFILLQNHIPGQVEKPNQLSNVFCASSTPVPLSAENSWAVAHGRSRSTSNSLVSAVRTCCNTLLPAPRLNLSALVNRMWTGMPTCLHQTSIWRSKSVNGWRMSIISIRPARHSRSRRYPSSTDCQWRFTFSETLA